MIEKNIWLPNSQKMAQHLSKQLRTSFKRVSPPGSVELRKVWTLPQNIWALLPLAEWEAAWVGNTVALLQYRLQKRRETANQGRPLQACPSTCDPQASILTWKLIRMQHL